MDRLYSVLFGAELSRKTSSMSVKACVWMCMLYIIMCRHVYICGDWLEGKIFSDTIKIAGQFVYAPGRW